MGLKLTTETLQEYIGKEIGVTDWMEVTQDDINTFADVTRDPQFIHVDPERAAQTPFGGPIAHGFFSLSMLSYFAIEGAVAGIEGALMGINYGFEKVRFLAPVPIGSRIRGRSTLVSAEERNPGQFLLRHSVTVDIEGQDKPALVAEWLTMQVKG